MPDGARRISAKNGHTAAIAALGHRQTVPHLAKLTVEQASLIESMAGVQSQTFLHAYRVPLTPEQHAELEADQALTNTAARVLLKRGIDLEQRYSRAGGQ